MYSTNTDASATDDNATDGQLPALPDEVQVAPESNAVATSDDVKQLIAERDMMNKRIDELSRAQRAKALTTIETLIREFNITPAEIIEYVQKKGTEKSKDKTTTTTKVPPKFRDPATQKTWSGRGIAPSWIAGKDRSQFAIPEGEIES